MTQEPITITPALIAAAERASACSAALAWLRETPRTVEELANHYPAWAEWAAVSIPDLPGAVRDRLQALGAGRSWWRNGELHREDGPAAEWADGTRHWWVNGRLHREDGPAVEYAEGSREWWVDGKRTTQPAWHTRRGYGGMR